MLSLDNLNSHPDNDNNFCTINKIEEARFLFSQGLSSKMISKKIKIRSYDIRLLLKYHNFKLDSIIFSEDKIPEIIEKYLNGSSIQNLSKIYSIHSRKIRKFVDNVFITKRTDMEINKDYFHTIDNSNKAYWLGFIFADGCVYNRNDRWQFMLAISDKDKNHLNHFAKEINFFEHDINTKLNSGSGKYLSEVRIFSSVFCENLFNLGVIPAKSLTCKFPIIPEDYKSDFIRGLFDGDGCILFNEQKKTARFDIVGTKEMLEPIQKHLVEHTKTNILLYKCNKENTKNTWRLIASGRKNTISVLEYLYTNSDLNNRLDRKYNIFMQLKAFSENDRISKSK